MSLDMFIVVSLETVLSILLFVYMIGWGSACVNLNPTKVSSVCVIVSRFLNNPHMNT